MSKIYTDAEALIVLKRTTCACCGSPKTKGASLCAHCLPLADSEHLRNLSSSLWGRYKVGERFTTLINHVNAQAKQGAAQ